MRQRISQPSKGPVATAVSLTEEAGALAAEETVAVEEEGVLAWRARRDIPQPKSLMDSTRIVSAELKVPVI
jgi:hypothetical protein